MAEATAPEITTPSTSTDAMATTHYVIEHFEEELSDWTLSEYTHMLLTLSKLYDTNSAVSQGHKEVLVITNFPFVAKLARGELEEDDLNTKRNTERFNRVINKLCFSGSVLLSELPFKDLTTANSSSGDQPRHDSDHTEALGQIFTSQISGDLGNICFMDFRADAILQPAERDQFRFVVFGGILGDHPPQDRAKDFRETFNHIRQLGRVQMTTDTALLVSHEILGQQKPFESLQFTEDPTIPMDDAIEHYLDKSMPLDNLCELPNEVSDFKTQVIDTQLRPRAQEFLAFRASQGGVPASSTGGVEDCQVEMSTIMDGFIYRVNDNAMYPVLKNGQPVQNFPVIPIGMMQIWREQDDEGDLEAMLQM